MELLVSGQEQPEASSGRDLELRELQETIVAMREALDLAEHEARERTQAAIAEATEEIGHLRTIVTALRTQLEERELAHAEALQAARQDAAGEIKDLQATIDALRSDLDAKQP